jgi:DNA-binding transcriptional regulator of glucitol operon
MSLKAFHIVFVAICVLLSLGFGYWAITEYRRTHEGALLACGVLSIAGAAALIVYGRWFLRKLRGVSYL